MDTGKTLIRICQDRNGRFDAQLLLDDIDDKDVNLYFALMGCLDFCKISLQKEIPIEDISNEDVNSIRKLLDNKENL